MIEFNLRGGMILMKVGSIILQKRLSNIVVMM